ncbi:3-phenylpropionate-dihydrodiol/cinnamic acid-dihydrodiol dehydrogenase [Photorhabdus luminescens]|uniref:3-(Cis-5,6-dihydroxycyclohexa-1, 3-dien-1-yl)propanoate dehydrogenase n=1 Tax=Photorhabdus luminescens subsp. sonorensis TaxID=1173677 RepID=A0A5C4RD32_PHOLU|nr:3-phenylpropionate-dihydrodiol/cinnamic acid-dihydrodiol dehydrogenase [Photorhabdus luminescens]TNH41943.1 3-(cis-5,6-dihydroxycyclohexa-1,3-dien-1-yl)propanoate dehydrogenase [Photorhabdus luminescens subsp. sonorensis]
MSWIKDQVILLTGGGSGLGLALVERFIAEGAKVGVLELSAEKATALAHCFGKDICVIHGDVASFEDNERAVAETVRRFGKLDCFVGNAGIWDHKISLLDASPEQIDKGFDELMGVNLKGYILGAKAALPALTASEGSMIFTLSNSSWFSGGGGVLYTASKHGAVGMVRQLAYELAPIIRVNGVAPCGMPSDLRGPATLSQQDRCITDSLSLESLGAFLPLQFTPQPKDFTGPYVMLASRANNRTLTGVMITADAGLSIRGIRQTTAGVMSPNKKESSNDC